MAGRCGMRGRVEAAATIAGPGGGGPQKMQRTHASGETVRLRGHEVTTESETTGLSERAVGAEAGEGIGTVEMGTGQVKTVGVGVGVGVGVEVENESESESAGHIGMCRVRKMASPAGDVQFPSEWVLSCVSSFGGQLMRFLKEF